MDAHSELMGAYPWGETTPSQTKFNLQDSVAVEGGKLVFREKGRPVTNAEPHDWAAVVGSTRTPTGSVTGANFRGPQDPPVICPASGPDTPDPPRLCDDTAYGKGKGGQLRYHVNVPAGGKRTVWFAVSGSESGAGVAKSTNASVLEDPEAALASKISGRLALQKKTDLNLPGDRRLQKSIDWSKQNFADSVQSAKDLEIRETNAGTKYPPPVGRLGQVRFLG